MKTNSYFVGNALFPAVKSNVSRKLAALIGAIFATAAATSYAQEIIDEVEIEKIVVAAADTPDATATRSLIIKSGSMHSGGAGTVFFGDDMIGARSDRQLKNAPYSATAVTEKVQVLRDGNELRQTTSKRLYRDAAGRTRDETMNANGEVTAVRINDLQESGAVYQLKPAGKTATKLNLGLGLGQALSGLDPLLQQKVNEALGKLKATGGAEGSTTTGTGTLEDPKITVTRVEGAGGTNSHMQGKMGEVLILERKGESKVITRSTGDGAAPESNRVKTVIVKRGGPVEIDTNSLGSHASEMLAGVMRDSSFAKTAVKSSLGSRDFSGVRAEGTLSTYTIPANAIGNQQPITVSDEIWKSPDLKLVVYSRRSDPREGDTIYRLENIQRVEQPLNLFAVPADYKIVEPSVSINRSSIAK
jgi:hypothetical protein